jgi:ribonuclease HII
MATTPLSFDQEQILWVQGHQYVVGIDEAGRGPLMGPVVAAAVVWKHGTCTPGDAGLSDAVFALIRDSKKLSPKQRDAAYELVQDNFYIGVGVIAPEVIDRVNILEATYLAMKSALSNLRSVLPKHRDVDVALLIDGNQALPNVSLTTTTVVGGDGTVPSIAAASIVAKVTRDRIVDELDQLYPQYGFAKHKGYGTADHMAALRRYGPSPVHRMSFKPVKMNIPEVANRKYSRVMQ